MSKLKLITPTAIGVLRGGYTARDFRGDFFGGLTAAVIALPLALAFGVASGAGPIAGLYGAIAIGFFASLFGGTPAQVSGPTGPMVAIDSIAKMLQPAFILALLGSIDSLLTSLVADSVTKTRHDSDKELVGQGIGNVAAGLFGGLPGAGATMRTVVNIRSGGRTAISGMLHAVILLGLALGLGQVVAYVPTAILAAILIKVGWDIIDWGYLRRIKRAPREKVIVMLVTVVLTVFVDLIMAVGVGIILAGFVNSRWLAEEQLKGFKQSANADELDLLTQDEKELLRKVNGRVLVTLLHGSFSYASARDLARRDTQEVSPHDVVIYDFTDAGYVDPSSALAIDDMIDLSQKHGRYVIVSGLHSHALNALDGMGVLERIPDTQIFQQRRAAIEAAVAYCNNKSG